MRNLPVVLLLTLVSAVGCAQQAESKSESKTTESKPSGHSVEAPTVPTGNTEPHSENLQSGKAR